MNHQLRHRVLLYLTLVSIFMMPFSAFGYVNESEMDSGTDMPCHSDSMSMSHDGPSAQDHDNSDCCGDTGLMMDCNHCFTVMAANSMGVLKTTEHTDSRPSTTLNSFKNSPQNNRYKPPRS
jgi:hypothetical protein